MSKKNDRLSQDLIDSLETIQVDCSVDQQDGTKKVILSNKKVYEGVDYWQARHPSNGSYWTSKDRNPQILNYATDPPRCRGNIKFIDGTGNNKEGRPKGSMNKKSVQEVLDSTMSDPSTFLAGVMKGDVAILKSYGVHSPKTVTLAQKISCAMKLIDKQHGNVKPVDVDSSGNVLGSSGDNSGEEKRKQIQAYIPAMPEKIEATEEEVVEYEEKGHDKYLSDHKDEYSNCSEELSWSVKET